MKKIISAMIAGLLLAGTVTCYEEYNATLSKSIVYYASATFCAETDL